MLNPCSIDPYPGGYPWIRPRYVSSSETRMAGLEARMPGAVRGTRKSSSQAADSPGPREGSAVRIQARRSAIPGHTPPRPSRPDDTRQRERPIVGFRRVIVRVGRLEAEIPPTTVVAGLIGPFLCTASHPRAARPPLRAARLHRCTHCVAIPAHRPTRGGRLRGASPPFSDGSWFHPGSTQE